MTLMALWLPALPPAPAPVSDALACHFCRHHQMPTSKTRVQTAPGPDSTGMQTAQLLAFLN